MNIFTVIGFILFGMVLFTGLFALMITRLDAAVAQNTIDIEVEKERYKPDVTLGFKIEQDADKTVQFRDARLEAAKRAASLGRGANMRIGRQGSEHGKTSSDDLAIDPISAFKISEYQGWQSMGDFAKAQEIALGGGEVAPAVTDTKVVRRKLVPGKDYEVTAITASMSAAEKRTARIANSKSKSAAYKVLKDSGQDMITASSQAAAAVPAAQAADGAVAAAPVAAPVITGPSLEEVLEEAGIAPLQLAEVTDDMDAAAKKEVRMANTKAKSAYKKALKAAGIDPKAHPTAAELAAAQAAAPAAAPVGAPAVPAAAVPAGPSLEQVLADAGIAPLELVELTDDMDAAAKKDARMANTKAKSAYKKALKAAGIDPKAHPTAAELAAAQAAAPPAPVATPAPVAAASAPAAAGPTLEQVLADAGITPLVLVELTDDMDAAAKKDARMANTKAKSAYKKALKAAGIDPKAYPSAADSQAAAPAATAPPSAPPAATEDPAPADEPGGIPRPTLIELTDDMDAAAKKEARMANTKAKSAYKKALKEAGIDPKSVKI